MTIVPPNTPMRISRLSMVVATGACVMVAVGIMASEAPWLARESIFEFTAREPKSVTTCRQSKAPPSYPCHVKDN